MDRYKDLSALAEELGPIFQIEQLCPGIYYLAAKNEDEPIAREYYAVTDAPAISWELKAYGRKLAGFWLFPLAEDASGWRIIDYEVGRYRVRNHLPQEESLHSIALSAAEYHPEYFGQYPVPICTSRGYTTRYWTLENGIYWIETDQCEEVLAICYPIWSSELTELAEQVGEQTENDRTHGIHQTLGYIFFPQYISAIPIYELMQTRSAWEGTLIDKAALMNAIWNHAPEYAALMNQQEQSGVNDIPAMLLRYFGIEAEPRILQDRMIRISPDIGEEFLLLKGYADGKRSL